MNYFLIAGEASGDRHAAALIASIRRQDPQAHFSGLGGDRMAAAECRLYQHIRQMAFMGFAAVLKNAGQVRRNFRVAREALMKEHPDVLVLVDYPSFNLRMASFCRRQLPETKIYYYVPPKVWAWKKRRVHAIARLCDRVLAIFPFESAFYARYGYKCTYVGNPTAEEINAVKKEPLKSNNSIAVLPGSRPSEITHCLPRMMEAVRRYPDYHPVVCAAPGIDEELYRSYLRDGDELTRDTWAAVQQAQAAVVNSGTATLETALLGCPQVAVYHLACSWLIGLIRRFAQPLLFSIPYFTLVNIIEGRQVIKECIANEFTVDKVADELNRLLTDSAYKKEMLASYKHLSVLLGRQPAADTAASIITSKP